MNSLVVDKTMFSGDVLIVMQKQSDVYKVLAGHPKKGLFGFIYNELARFFCICSNPSDFWTFERASEPKDIQWHNLGQNFMVRFIKNFISSSTSIAIIIVSGVIITLMKSTTKQIPSD